MSDTRTIEWWEINDPIEDGEPELLDGEIQCPKCQTWIAVRRAQRTSLNDGRGGLPEVTICGDGCCQDYAYYCPNCGLTDRREVGYVKLRWRRA